MSGGDSVGLARELAKQAEIQLKVNTRVGDTKAVALAGLAQTTALVAIYELLDEVLHTIAQEVCRDPGYHDHG